eukprot:UN06572
MFQIDNLPVTPGESFDFELAVAGFSITDEVSSLFTSSSWAYIRHHGINDEIMGNVSDYTSLEYALHLS